MRFMDQAELVAADDRREMLGADWVPRKILRRRLRRPERAPEEVIVRMMDVEVWLFLPGRLGRLRQRENLGASPSLQHTPEAEDAVPI